MGARDEVDANLDEGHDTATRVENRLHGGHSHVGGIYGYIEFKINTRLTQSINHYLRSRLFERIKALPMTTLEDQRIGDSVYRVMYDTPSINMPFYEGWGRTVNCIAAIAMAVGTFMSAYPESPGFVLITAAVFPSSSCCRRRFGVWRGVAVTTSTIEEGMDNVLAVQSLGGAVGPRLARGPLARIRAAKRGSPGMRASGPRSQGSFHGSVHPGLRCPDAQATSLALCADAGADDDPFVSGSEAVPTSGASAPLTGWTWCSIRTARTSARGATTPRWNPAVESRAGTSPKSAIGCLTSQSHVRVRRLLAGPARSLRTAAAASSSCVHWRRVRNALNARWSTLTSRSSSGAAIASCSKSKSAPSSADQRGATTTADRQSHDVARKPR